tara:strand:+ start:954 stop:1670 length:717 start_codon:yes stop_codon:yes gene_type:complete
MTNRLIEIDAMRGIAILFMVIFHIALSENLFSNKNYNLHGGFLEFTGHFSRTLFLFLMGTSLVLAYKKKKKENKSYRMFQINRGTQILVYGLIVTFLTKMVLPQQYVAFGILHFIGLTIILLSFIIDKKFIIYLVLVICLTAWGNLNSKDGNLFNYVLGTNYNYHGWTIDYFPLLKNIPKVLAGVLFGYYYVNNPLNIREDIKNNKIVKILEKLGKQSLNIYMLHLPIVYFLSKGLKI